MKNSPSIFRHFHEKYVHAHCVERRQDTYLEITRTLSLTGVSLELGAIFIGGNIASASRLLQHLSLLVLDRGLVSLVALLLLAMLLHHQLFHVFVVPVEHRLGQQRGCDPTVRGQVIAGPVGALVPDVGALLVVGIAAEILRAATVPAFIGRRYTLQLLIILRMKS